MSGCCLATLKLRLIGDGEQSDERVRLNEAAVSVRLKGLRSAAAKQLRRLELLSASRRDAARVSRSPPLPCGAVHLRSLAIQSTKLVNFSAAAGAAKVSHLGVAKFNYLTSREPKRAPSCFYGNV